MDFATSGNGPQPLSVLFRDWLRAFENIGGQLSGNGGGDFRLGDPAQRALRCLRNGTMLKA